MNDLRLSLPDDPTGIAEAHDILAAEEWAMPSGPDQLVHKLRSGDGRGRVLVLAAAAFAAIFFAAARRH
jgi:hypothetical protein